MSAISKLDNLRYLTISCLVTRMGLEAIRSMKLLRSLQISYPGIIESDIEAIGSSIPSLQEVNAFMFRGDPAVLRAN